VRWLARLPRSFYQDQLAVRPSAETVDVVERQLGLGVAIGFETLFRASLPENPAGLAMVDDSALRSANGAVTLHLCGGTTFVDSCVKPGQQCP
jgi:hypothetical protein